MRSRIIQSEKTIFDSRIRLKKNRPDAVFGIVYFGEFEFHTGIITAMHTFGIWNTGVSTQARP